MTSLGFRPNLDGFFDASLDLQMHVYRRTEAALAEWQARRSTVTTPDDVRREQERIRAAVRAGVGGLPDAGSLEVGGPVPWESTGLVDGDGYVVEKVIYESLPGAYVTANLYRPSSTASGGAVLFVCGHSEEAKAYGPYQRVCGRLARTGLMVLAIDPPGQGERLSYLDDDGAQVVEWGTTEHTYAGVQCWWLGQSPARWFVHDARRAVDLLASLPEVDPARIGITGNSGGGTLTTLLMALEPRLVVAAPGTFVSGRGPYLWSGQRQDGEQILLGGTASGVDHADFLIAMAPRPVLVLAVEYDFFPYEATLETVEAARRYFDIAGAPDALRLVSSPATHGYDDVLGRAAAEFLAEHLGGKVTDDSVPSPLESSALQCTESGQVIRDRPETRRIFDLNLVEYEHRPQVDVAHAKAWLTDRVRAHRRVAERPTPRWLGSAERFGRRGFWRSELDLWNAGVLLGATPPRSSPEGTVLPADPPASDTIHIALLDRGTSELTTEHRVHEVAGGDALLVLDVRGTGALTPYDSDGRAPDDIASSTYKLECDLMWLDDSLAAGQLFDVLRTVDLLVSGQLMGWSPARIRLYGEGIGAFYATLATAIDSRIESVTLHGPVLDVDGLLRRRYHDDGRGDWRALLPGFAANVPPAALEELVRGRVS